MKYRSIFVLLFAFLMINSIFAGAYVVTNNEDETINQEVELFTGVDFFIKAVDHPDILNNNKIDNIAVITLNAGAHLSISDINIYISYDMLNWIKTDIIEDGLWKVGNQITIKEKNIDDAQTSFYDLRVMMPGERLGPLAECFISVDNAPFDTFSDKRPMRVCKNNVGMLYIPEFQESTGGNNGHLTSLGVQYLPDFTRWDKLTQTWEYNMYICGCHDGGMLHNRFLSLQLYSYPNSGVDSKTYIRIGGWHVDEYEETDFEKIAVAVCELAVNAIPNAGFIYSGYKLATLLGHAPDVKWTPSENTDCDYSCSGFCYQKIYVPPNTNWQIQYDLECIFYVWYGPGSGSDTIDFKLYNRITCGEISDDEPPECMGNIDISTHSISFGTVTKGGSSKSESFKIINHDRDSCLEWNVGDSGPFDINPNSGWLAADSSTTVHVSVDPDDCSGDTTHTADIFVRNTNDDDDKERIYFEVYCDKSKSKDLNYWKDRPLIKFLVRHLGILSSIKDLQNL